MKTTISGELINYYQCGADENYYQCGAADAAISEGLIRLALSPYHHGMSLWTATVPNRILRVDWAVCHVLSPSYIFDHVGEALHIKNTISLSPDYQGITPTLFSLKCYVHRKRKHTSLNTLGVLREGRRKFRGGGGLGEGITADAFLPWMQRYVFDSGNIQQLLRLIYP